MKTIIKGILFFGLLALSFSSCVTGNDNNAVLQDLEDEFAKTPRVLNLEVDGIAPSRDQQSHWLDFEVTPGQTIRITGEYHPGEGAGSATIDFSRSYHHISYNADDAKVVEPNQDRLIAVPGGAPVIFDFSYTVPSVDDEGEEFTVGDHINLSWWSSNDLGGQGFTDINLIYR